jgi:hypothetical protein
MVDAGNRTLFPACTERYITRYANVNILPLSGKDLDLPIGTKANFCSSKNRRVSTTPPNNSPYIHPIQFPSVVFTRDPNSIWAQKNRLSAEQPVFHLATINLTFKNISGDNRPGCKINDTGFASAQTNPLKPL